MSWIESHQSLIRHPKVLHLSVLLGVPLDTTLGRLHLLWWWCLDYALDGRLDKHEKSVIETSCSIPVDHLITCGFLDNEPFLRIHDWWDYAGRFIKTKYKNYPEKIILIEKEYKDQSKGTPKGTPKGIPKGTPKTPNLPTNLNLPTNKDICHPGDETAGPTPTDLIYLWNKFAHPNLPRVKELTDNRKKYAGARLVDHPDVEFWETVIAKVNASPLLRGEKGGWRASFDWIINPTNLVKIVEGNYDEKQKFF